MESGWESGCPGKSRSPGVRRRFRHVKTAPDGGIITELHTPDRDGKLADVVLGFDNLQSYLAGKSGVVYKKYSGLCLDAQHFPDAVHHPHFPSIILKPGSTYTQPTVYKFSAK